LCGPDCGTPSSFCGDGVIDPGEECDDGNTTPGDGCDENCQNETPSLIPSNQFNIGDSIGEAEAADGTIGEAHHDKVWSTGYEITDIVNSINERFEYLDPAAYYENILNRDSTFNQAVSGSVMGDFAAQATQVVNAAALTPSGNAGMVTVLLGNNDVCEDSLSAMTDPALFEAQYRQGLDILASSDLTKNAEIHVSGIPAIYWLWVAKKDSSGCRLIWWFGSVCQALLQNPTDDCESEMSRDDPDNIYPNDGPNCLRRKEFHRRIKEIYNPILRDVLQEYINDGRLPNAYYVDIFDIKFDADHVNNGDCFHPSTQGHEFLADEQWCRTIWGSEDPLCSP
jgi:cysteine-rich repeat protein